MDYGAIRRIIREELVELSFSRGGDVYDVSWRWPVGDPTPDNEVQNFGHFTGDDGLRYKIKVNGFYDGGPSPGTLRVDFGTQEKGDALTGSGEPLKILRTVVTATREVFDAHGGRDVFSRIMVGSAGPKRERIYKAILKRLFPEGTVKQYDSSTFYVMI
jgi:hypothetical protein